MPGVKGALLLGDVEALLRAVAVVAAVLVYAEVALLDWC